MREKLFHDQSPRKNVADLGGGNRVGQLTTHSLTNHSFPGQAQSSKRLTSTCLFVLRSYGPVNPMESCQAWSVYLTTRLLVHIYMYFHQ